MNYASYKKSSFGPAFLFLSKERRKALSCYYAFCRMMDDIVDEPGHTNPAQELDEWTEEIRRVYNGTPQTSLGRDLQKAVRRFDIPADRFLLLIEGMRADLTPHIYVSYKDLEWYLYRVACVVGLAVTDILGVQNQTADEVALALGQAVQLTNIIRDVWEDAQNCRVYLPQEDLHQFGLSEKDILLGSQPEQIARLLAFEAERAEALYKQAYRAMRGPYWQKLLPCRIMGYVYYANLAKIKESGFLFRRKIKLTKAEKIRNLIYALFKNIG